MWAAAVPGRKSSVGGREYKQGGICGGGSSSAHIHREIWAACRRGRVWRWERGMQRQRTRWKTSKRKKGQSVLSDSFYPSQRDESWNSTWGIFDRAATITYITYYWTHWLLLRLSKCLVYNRYKTKANHTLQIAYFVRGTVQRCSIHDVKQRLTFDKLETRGCSNSWGFINTSVNYLSSNKSWSLGRSRVIFWGRLLASIITSLTHVDV